MINQLLNSTRTQAAHRVWIISDLQQGDPEHARFCMQTAVTDFRALGMPCERIWYLGDSVEGNRLDFLETMTDMQVELLQPLGIPLRFVLGNHELDYTRSTNMQTVNVPFHRAATATAGWETTASLSDFYFTEDFGGYLVVFLSDHVDPAGEWITTHGYLEGAYPYDEEAYAALRDLIASAGKPVITASHYPFAGGNRPSALLDRLLPLPPNVRLHVYGHAHIGDGVWAGKDCYRKIAWVERQPIPQIDVASLENHRGDAIRSVFLEIYPDGALGVFFRDHQRGEWTEAYFVDKPPAE